MLNHVEDIRTMFLDNSVKFNNAEKELNTTSVMAIQMDISQSVA